MKLIYCSIVLLLLITACSAPTAITPTIAPPIKTLPLSPTGSISTSTATLTATAESYPTFTPAPTSTAIPPLKPGQQLRLTTIDMIDEQSGWGIDMGEHIVRTTDGGHTWKDVTPPGGAYRKSGFFALDDKTAWATAYQDACYTDNCPPAPNNASIWHTVDGGNTWQEQHVCLQDQDCRFIFAVSPSYYYPKAINFLDSKTGWLLITVEHVMFQDRYRLYTTNDGGTHWMPVMDSDSRDAPMLMSVTGMAFQDQQTGWMSASQIDGATDPMADWSIYQSTNAGMTWNNIPLPQPNPLPDSFLQNQVWCGADGVNANSPNVLSVTIECRVYTDPWSTVDFYFRSTDGGQHWISWLKTGDAQFIDSLVGWRLALNQNAYDLEQTHDGGQTWQAIKTVQWKGQLDFVNEQTGWSIATNNRDVALLHTVNGGETWQELQPIVSTP